jgi:transposase
MVAPTRSPRRRARANNGLRGFVHKPRGRLNDRVHRVGPQHFGIVCVDCAKARSKWMLCDFFGKVLLPPTELPHIKAHLDLAIVQLQEATERHALQDQIVAIERTGNYHQPVKRAFAAAGFETRMVHPLASKQFRQLDDPGNKTDDTDLVGIFRAAVNGFGLAEAAIDEVSHHLQLFARHRRDLVEKRSAVYCQVREHLDAVLPGYAAQFDKLWESQVAMPIARHFSSPQAIREAKVEGLQRLVKSLGRRTFEKTLQQVVIWAGMAASPDPAASVRHQIMLMLDDDRKQKTLEIQAIERQLAHLLVRAPYVLLLSHPGINVVSASQLAGEAGPISDYASAKAITGRAGLFPSRYQSDQVDVANGQLIRRANRTLRAALMLIADNLLNCNAYYKALGAAWKAQGRDTRRAHVKVASRFSRCMFQMVAGRQVFRHPSQRGRDYILDKLLAFHREHTTPMNQVLADLQTAIQHVPSKEHAAEAMPLKLELQKTLAARRRGPQPIAEILPLVLARLDASPLQSTASEAQDPS